MASRRPNEGEAWTERQVESTQQAALLQHQQYIRRDLVGEVGVGVPQVLGRLARREFRPDRARKVLLDEVLEDEVDQVVVALLRIQRREELVAKNTAVREGSSASGSVRISIPG
jgi:hypothetical protein